MVEIWAKTSLNSYISLEASFNLFFSIVISFIKKMNSGKTVSNEWKGREQKEKKNIKGKKNYLFRKKPTLLVVVMALG